MKILTGNDLKTGDVLWWAGGDQWSRHIADAKDSGDEVDTIIAREQAARRVNDAYAVDAALTNGIALPLHIKDRVRASGPTVRQDLAVNAAIPITHSAMTAA